MARAWEDGDSMDARGGAWTSVLEDTGGSRPPLQDGHTVMCIDGLHSKSCSVCGVFSKSVSMEETPLSAPHSGAHESGQPEGWEEQICWSF